MPCSLDHLNIANGPSFRQLYLPVYRAMLGMPSLESRGDRSLKMSFEDQFTSSDGTSRNSLPGGNAISKSTI